MAVSESFRQFVMEQLEEAGPMTSRRMFGGVGINCQGLFFALIASNTLYFKVDNSNRGDFEEYGMKPFKPFKDKKMVMQYFEVPADILEDRFELAVWAQKAIDVAARAKSSEK
jgi:DNA transformation protein